MAICSNCVLATTPRSIDPTEISCQPSPHVGWPLPRSRSSSVERGLLSAARRRRPVFTRGAGCRRSAGGTHQFPSRPYSSPVRRVPRAAAPQHGDARPFLRRHRGAPITTVAFTRRGAPARSLAGLTGTAKLRYESAVDLDPRRPQGAMSRLAALRSQPIKRDFSTQRIACCGKHREAVRSCRATDQQLRAPAWPRAMRRMT